MLSMLFSKEWRIRGLILVCLDRVTALFTPYIPHGWYVLLFAVFIALDRIESRNYYLRKYDQSISKMVVKHTEEIAKYKKKIYKLEQQLREFDHV